jgi:hypothetical protein
VPGIGVRACGKTAARNKQKRLVEVDVVTFALQLVDPRHCSFARVDSQTPEKEDLSAVEVEQSQLARPVSNASVAGACSIESSQSRCETPLSAFGESQVVGGHRCENWKLVAEGHLLGLCRRGPCGFEVVGVRVRDRAVEVYQSCGCVIARFDEQWVGTFERRQSLVVRPAALLEERRHEQHETFGVTSSYCCGPCEFGLGVVCFAELEE